MEMEMGMPEDYQKVINQIDPYVPRSKMELQIDVLSNVLHGGVKPLDNLLVLVDESLVSMASNEDMVDVMVPMLETPETP